MLKGIFRLKHLFKLSFLNNKDCNYLRLFSNVHSSFEMKYLNVAEKNDAAKTIAGHLSRGTSRRREGLSTYNKIYEFEATVFGQKCTMIMTSVSGHLLGYEFVGSYKVWQSCNPLLLFDAPVVKSCSEDYQKIKKTLEREIRGCQGLIIWTDCDREGENIGFEIIQVCSDIKSNLKIYRAKFSEITAQSVNRALQTLDAPNKNISDAVDVRQELDLRIGAAFTRFQTLRLQKVFPEKLARNLVSYGSCQFPTLGFVVERYRAVENFVPEKFWKLKVSHTMNDLTVDFLWKRVRLFDEQACMSIHDLCCENPNATVTNIKSKSKSKWRPLPLDTIELEKIGSRKLRINAKEIMKIAEKLYTQGIISYPRTETNIYPKELNLSTLVENQRGDQEWGQFAQKIMQSGGPTPRQGNKSDQAHPPIHPTKHVTNLSGNDKKVYDLIVRSFLACCSSDAQGYETIVEIDIAGEIFTANGLMIIARNYLEVYPYDKWSAKEIHVYEEGQSFEPTQLDIVDGQTSAPNLLTEADLIALMEKHGIGTDATHADHIETIKNRSYVALADSIHFVPGLLGMGLVEGYDAMGLSFSKPHLRAALEADLKEICEGRKRPNDVLTEQISKYKEVYVTVTEEATKIDQALSERFNERAVLPVDVPNAPLEVFHKNVMKCPKCKSDMTLRSKKDGQGMFISCMGYPGCKNVIWLPAIINKVRVMDESCEKCGPTKFKLEIIWKGRSLEHLYPSPYVCCIGGCDTHILEFLNINLSSVQSSRPNGLQIVNSDSVRSNVTVRNVVSATQNTNPQRTNVSIRSATNNTLTQNHTSDSNIRNEPNGNSRSNQYHTQANSNNISPNQTRNPAVGWFSDTRDSGYSSTYQNDSRGSSFVQDRSRGGSNQARGGAHSNTGWKSSQPANDDDNQVVCNCGVPAILLTVKKQNTNCGREFYKCQKPKDAGGCDFFLWATSNEGTTSTTTNNDWRGGNDRGTSMTTGSTSWGNNSSWGGNDGNSSWDNAAGGSNSDVPKCECNLPSKSVTVQKEGPNKGRSFYGCPNYASNRCKFFQWADNLDQPSFTTRDFPSTSNSSRQNYTSSTRGRGRGSSNRGSRGTGERGKKRCGACREEGHTRNKCPKLD